MQLSILIASYDWDVTELVQELHRQSCVENLKFEILIADNCTNSSLSGKLNKLNEISNVDYRVENVHIGRAANRNHLAERAQGEWLLFIDADAEVKNETFIQSYWNSKKINSVTCGGTAYDDNPPQRSSLLRFRYGKHREELSASTRNRHPWKGFSAFNFFIERKIFIQIQMKGDLVRYGHEDSLFGIELMNRGIFIQHIDNPLIHKGLDSNDVFLKKTDEGVQSLVELIQLGTNPNFTSLSSIGERVANNKLLNIATQLFWKLFGKWITTRLLSGRAGVQEFDLYKLNRYLHYSSKS